MKAALVTGSAAGLGKAIAIRLAKDGFNIAIADLHERKAEVTELEEEITRLGGNSVYIPTDVSDKESVRAAIERAYEVLGSLDVVVNNAGICLPEPINTLSVEKFNRMWQVNVLGCLYGIQAAVGLWERIGQSSGKIINASSVGGQTGGAYFGGYCATKFAITALTQSAAKELGPKGITVNAYCPGAFETGGFNQMVKDLHQMGIPQSEDQIRNTYTKRSALRRKSSPEDVANVVSFLASSNSDHITGQSIVIDGGSKM
ncbi:hypothetical protein TRICI_001925 [Trichomonascus ciferrii]|uniref:Diacetyl reductase [(S)-acetoin forming] n=1 Tax=Trichomonascus ciferrii TaxID=44093 RepID=A0A642V7Z7_9ASCO|nr:hypothetical protein TRICI_001925 [Trichomonascus ciferrii]